ncbi:MAG: hypothetical protein AAFO07_10645, partial [Bacteroidota bacterium]
MEENKQLNQIARYLSGNSTSDEQELLAAWIKENEDNEQSFEELSFLWEEVDKTEEELDLDVDLAWTQLDGKINEQEDKVVISSTDKAQE